MEAPSQAQIYFFGQQKFLLKNYKKSLGLFASSAYTGNAGQSKASVGPSDFGATHRRRKRAKCFSSKDFHFFNGFSPRRKLLDLHH